MILGVDFGTSHTVAASLEDGTYTVCRFTCNGESKEYIPSLIAVKDGSIKFGWDAVSCENDPNVYLMRSLKRMCGHCPPDLDVELAPDVHVTILELTALFLGHVKEMLKNNSSLSIDKDKPIEVMIATPANANTNQRYITMEAFKKAGFTVKGMLNEPTATAIEFSHRYLKKPGNQGPVKNVVVYDLGGGTFDASVIGLDNNYYDVITHEGVAKLGGDDIDTVILDLVLQRLNKQRKELSQSDHIRLLEECRKKKEGIDGFGGKLTIDVSHVFHEERHVQLDKKDIYNHCEPIIQQSLDTLNTAIKTFEMTETDSKERRNLDAIYLTGGAVAFPLVTRRLHDQFGKKVRISPYPEASTAIGLAISAGPALSGRLREAVTRNLGVWREYGTNKIFDTIIDKRSRLETQSGTLRIKRTYNPIHNLGHLRFIECSSLGQSGEPSGDITDIKEIFFPYDPQLKDEERLYQVPVMSRPDLSTQEVTETYSYDSRGIITLEIENLSAQYKKTYILSQRYLPVEADEDVLPQRHLPAGASKGVPSQRHLPGEANRDVHPQRYLPTEANRDVHK
ncbi:MAG: Hsp70 family protein [bacterium]